MFSSIVQHYHWQAALTVVLLTASIIQAGKFLAFRIPDIRRMREINIEEDRKRLAHRSTRR